MKNNFAVLLLSCDKYSDMWAPFLKQFRTCFVRHDIPLYVGSNTVSCEEEGVLSVLSGDGQDWSTSCKRILAQIQEKKLFVILEDQIPVSTIDMERFDYLVKFMFEADANHIKYWDFPKTEDSTEYFEIGAYPKGIPYRATICGFWDRECLMSLLIEGENPWNFEILGSYRTSYIDGFFGVSRSLFERRNMIEKGRWVPESVDWAKNVGIELDLGARPMLQGHAQLTRKLKMLYFDVVACVPWRKRVALMNVLRKALISY